MAAHGSQAEEGGRQERRCMSRQHRVEAACTHPADHREMRAAPTGTGGGQARRLPPQLLPPPLGRPPGWAPGRQRPPPLQMPWGTTACGACLQAAAAGCPPARQPRAAAPRAAAAAKGVQAQAGSWACCVGSSRRAGGADGCAFLLLLYGLRASLLTVLAETACLATLLLSCWPIYSSGGGDVTEHGWVPTSPRALPSLPLTSGWVTSPVHCCSAHAAHLHVLL